MFKLSKLSLKKSFSVLFGLQLIIIVVIGFLIFTLYKNQDKLAKSRDNYFNSYLLADELRQSSDDLSRFARAYVATGDAKFEQYYWDVANIRDGKIPRPENYNRIYWDFNVVEGQKISPAGEKISLLDLMVRQGFTADELAKLDLAKKNSDALIKTETIAMNAIKGLFNDGNGNFTVKKEPDFKMASDLMNNRDYYRYKAEIMRPIDDFYILFQQRTGSVVLKYLNLARYHFWVIIILVISVFILAIFSFFFVRHQIIIREISEDKLAKLSKNLEMEVHKRTDDLEKAKQKLEETLKRSEELNKYMVGRELKMVELKKMNSSR